MGSHTITKEEARGWLELAIKMVEASHYPYAEIVIDSNGLQLNFLPK